MKKGGLRVGLIGVGPISDWHARALRVAGLELTTVSSRPGSSRVQDFAKRHGVAHVANDWKHMLDEPDRWDALVIATHLDATPQVLDAAMMLGVPILVEKPVAWNAARLADLTHRAHENVIVGYNRRFYRPVQAAREEARRGGPLMAHLALPESVTSAPVSDQADRYLRPFIDNSSHGVDLLRFLFGDLRIEAARQLRVHNRLAGFGAVLSSERGDVVQVTGNWATPANYALSLSRPGRRFELLPFEGATIYEGMDVVEPSEEFPVRRYLPKAVSRISLDDIDTREKPGFVSQALALRAIMEGKARQPDGATLHDAVATLVLCEGMIGTPLSQERGST